MRSTPPDTVVALYLTGVEAVVRTSAQLSGTRWEGLACGSWTAEETARHVLAVARWYHAWLDRALAGELSPPFTPEEMDRQNAAELSGLSDLDGPAAVAEFAATAPDYVERAKHHWDRAFAYPYGLVTAGLHLAVAAAEWHLHAWDLSRLLPVQHTPDDPRRLLLAAGECVSAAQGGARGAAMRLVLPLASRHAPWETMLKRSGRTPTT